jgi:hypothetical protein
MERGIVVFLFLAEHAHVGDSEAMVNVEKVWGL